MDISRREFLNSAEEMYKRVLLWCEDNPRANFDEIANELGKERRNLMGNLLSDLVTQNRESVEALETQCPSCGGETENKGLKSKQVIHPEGEAQVTRCYRYCGDCGKGFYPLDKRLNLTNRSLSPGTIDQVVLLGAECTSYEGAAMVFEKLAGVSCSKSSIHRLVGEVGSALVEKQESEAKAMVQVPKSEEEVLWREAPEPESEVMAVSSDGVMVNIIDEGWKEVKLVSVSAVTQTVDEESGELKAELSHHSYRGGLWNAATFTNHHWAEACHRGLERAKTIVCISDGALWIWAMVLLCFAHRIEILDWWHAVSRLWDIALGTFDKNNAKPWVKNAKGMLARSQLRYLLRQVRILYPRGESIPPSVISAIKYLFHNRNRIDYATYRQLGLPIGSGTIESACKSVVQARMKQAGMRWSRNGAQNMIALRCLLRSNRWHQIPELINP